MNEANAVPPSPEQGKAEEPLAYRAVRGGIWVVAGSYWSIGVGFAANILLMRLLTPAIYGEFALAMFFYTFLQLRGKIALNYAFAQQRAVTGETVGTLFTLDVLLGWGGALLALITVPILLHLGYSPPVAWIMLTLAVLSGLESFVGVFSVVLESALRFKPVSVIGGLAMPLSYLPAFAFALSGRGEYSLVAQAVSFSLISLMAGGLYVVFAQRDLFRLRWRYDHRLAWDYIRFGAVTGLGNYVASLVTQTDNFILGTLSGTTTLGYYDRAYRIAQWPSLLLSALIGRAAIFTYSRLREDSMRLQRAATMVLWISAIVAAPVALALFLSAPELVPFLFGAQWTPAVPILRVLLLLAVLRPIWENIGALFIGSGQPRRVIEISALQLLILALVGAPLTLAAGALGMASAAVLAIGGGLAAAYWMLRRSLTLDIRSILLGPVLASLLTVLTYWLLVRLIGSAHPLWFAIAWKIGWALCGFFLFLALLQPALFQGRIAYVWRLLRGRAEKRDEQMEESLP